jgi:hypothetical protein
MKQGDCLEKWGKNLKVDVDEQPCKLLNIPCAKLKEKEKIECHNSSRSYSNFDFITS